jgi:hypothetical protein
MTVSPVILIGSAQHNFPVSTYSTVVRLWRRIEKHRTTGAWAHLQPENRYRGILFNAQLLFDQRNERP